MLLSFTVLVLSTGITLASSKVYSEGFKITADGVEAVYRNDLRQLQVNSIARQHGSGVGTADWYGVPGSGIDFTKSMPLGPNTYSVGSVHRGTDEDNMRFGSGQIYFGGYGDGDKFGYKVPSSNGYGYINQETDSYAKPNALGNGKPQTSGYGKPVNPAYANPQTSGYGKPQTIGYGKPIDSGYGDPQSSRNKKNTNFKEDVNKSTNYGEEDSDLKEKLSFIQDKIYKLQLIKSMLQQAHSSHDKA